MDDKTVDLEKSLLDSSDSKSNSKNNTVVSDNDEFCYFVIFIMFLMLLEMTVILLDKL